MSTQENKKSEPPDEIIHKFQQTQWKMADLQKSFDELKDNLNDISSKYSGILQKHNDLSNFIQDSFKSNLHIHDVVKKRLDNHEIDIGRLEQSIVMQGQLNTSHNNQIMVLEDKIKDLNSSLKLLPDFTQINDILTKLSNLHQTVTANDEMKQKLLTEAKENHQKLKSELQSVPYDLASIKEKIIAHESKLAFQESCLHAIKTKLTETLSTSNAYVDKQLDARIPPVQPQVPLVSKEDVQKMIKATHEAVKLDASNAHLKASNNDMKLVILEKKIENLQLLLNKMQMQG